MSVERVFVGDDERYYPTLGLEVKPGEVREFETADDVPDDGRWETVSAAKKAGVKPIKPDNEPETAEATEEIQS